MPGDDVRGAGHPFKAACGLVRADNSRGTAYLVAPDRAVTCWHVVQDVGAGGHTVIDFTEHAGDTTVVRDATVAGVDRTADAALLMLDRPISEFAPLPLANGCKWKANWDGFGYPALQRGDGSSLETGVPLEGVVTDPSGHDDSGVPVLRLRSEEAAAGMAAPLHGFSGSPVMVEHLVVGHLKRFMGDPDYPSRPAFGLIWATPVKAVLALLGVSPDAVPTVAPPHEGSPTDLLTNVKPGEYNAFISYRSDDRTWALALADRLEGDGLKVFIDQRELVPGDPLVPTLHQAIFRSHAAIIVLSNRWLESRWCREESNALLARAVQVPEFRVVPVRIDDCSPPPEFQSRIWLDFSGKPGPEGDGYRRLLYALSGQTPPREPANEPRVFRLETQATDEVLAEVRAASVAGNAKRVLALWQRWHTGGISETPVDLVAAETLIQLGRPDQAMEVLKNTEKGVRAEQLRALALSKVNQHSAAIERLVRLKETQGLDAETGGILGGVYRRVSRKKRVEEEKYLRAAADIYTETFLLTGDTYPGINAAALALKLGNRPEATRLAGLVSTALEKLPEKDLDHWKLATAAEARLILGDLEGARSWYARAVSRKPEAVENIAVMRQGARDDLKALGQPENGLDDVFHFPKIAAFTGHMTDVPGRPVPRFPPAWEGRVRRAIGAKLDELGVGFGFSSAARGSDLLFLEELLARDGRARVYLPFPKDDFAKVSVGYGWDDRYRAVLQDARVELTVLADQVPREKELPASFAACSKKVSQEAVAFAHRLGEESVLIAVWNGQSGDGAGGTADAVKAWREARYPDAELIDISKL